MDTLSSYNLFVVQNNNHTRYDSFRDKMDTIDYIVGSPNVIANMYNVNSETDIPSDYCKRAVTLTSEKLRSDDGIFP